MQTQIQSKEAAPKIIRRAEVNGVVHVVAMDRAAADRAAQAIRAPASASARGPIDVKESYDECAARITLTVTGSLAGVLRLLNAKSPSGVRLFDERADASLVASVDNVGVEKAAAINDHLLNAAQNRPADDPPLDVHTEHDEREKRLRVKVSGSLFAASYLLFLVSLHLTQSRT